MNLQVQGFEAEDFRLGLYRTTTAEFGECARVHPDAGDCAPYLPPEIYDALCFKPAFADLPTLNEYEAAHPPKPVRVQA